VARAPRGCRSHGNQQRIQLIAALVNEPELLVLDEPFAGLDPLAMGAMGDLLAELAADGATVLFSSHQLDLVESLCEDVAIIDHGRIVLAGDLTDLRATVPDRFVEVRFRGPAPDWSTLPTAQVVESEDGRTRLRVDPRIDLPSVLSASQHDGDLVSFVYQPPTLTELFRQAVTR
jgi:ABC-2 type transport system ATP-binding protein